MPQQSTSQTISTSRSRSPLFLGALALVLALLAFQNWSTYKLAEREAHISAANLSDTLAREIAATLDRTQNELNAFAYEAIEGELFSRSDQQQWNILGTRMGRHLNTFRQVLTFRAFDAEGNSVAGAGEGAQIKVNIGDRDWFRQLRENPKLPFVISDVLISRATGRHAVFFAVPVLSRDGAFLGAFNASINLSWYQSAINELDIGPDGLVTLRFRGSGRLLMRRPLVEEQINAPNTGLSHLYASDLLRSDGTFVSAVDGHRRAYAYRVVQHYPLAVVVALRDADYLQAWFRQTVLTMVAATILGGLMALLYRRLILSNKGLAAQTQELAALNQELRRSNEELEEFTYIASHDLKSPLRNIASFAQLLERRFKDQLGNDGDEFIRYIVDNTMRMSGLIQDLLAYTRVSHDPSPPQPISAADVLAGTLDDLAQTIDATHTHICVSDLPMVAFNEHHLSCLFLNLIDNAIKYRHQDRTPVITVACERMPDQAWLFSVSDNGIGISPEYWDKIFRIFQRLHTVDQYEGSGIGLALCRRILSRYGGDIWVSSQPGQGSTFFFKIPA